MTTTRPRNSLTNSNEKLEERVLYSISALENTLPIVLAPPTQNANQTQPSTNLAPTVAREIRSSSTTDVTLRYTTLSVLGADDRGESNLSYRWSIVSAPENGSATFARNDSNSAKQTGVIFTKAGQYTFKVDITDSQGATTSRQVQLNVIPTMSKLAIQTPEGKVAGPTVNVRVTTTSQKLTVVALDQFGNAMENQPIANWSVVASPEFSQASFQTVGNEATIQLSQGGAYSVQATIGSFTTSTKLDVRSVLSQVRIASGGKTIVSGASLNVTELNQIYTIQAMDQFGRLLANDPSWNWSATSTSNATTNFTTVGDRTDVQFSQFGTYSLSLVTGGISQAFSVTTTNPVKAPTPQLTAARELSTLAPTTGKTFLVNSPSELTKAIKDASSGDTILLKGGVDFGDLKIYKPANPYTGTVTIKSEDPNNRAVLNSVTLVNVSNVSIENVAIQSENRYAAIVINGSRNVQLKDSDVTANLDPYKLGQTLVAGLDLRTSENISISNSTFHNLGTGLSVNGSSNVLVEGNTFRENLMDNANFGSNISEVMIRGNSFYSQVAKLYPDHHYDNIQLWVQTDATQNSRNISILENSIYDLSGAVEAQAIFGRGDYRDENGVLNPFGFENIEVANNLIVTQHANAIAFTDVQGLRIHDNTLVYSGDRGGNPEDVNLPGIRQSLSSNAFIYNNIMPEKYGYPGADTEGFFGNVRYNIHTGALAELLVNPYATEPTRDDFASLNVSKLKKTDGTTMGAFTASSSASMPTALFSYSYQLVDGQYVYRLDASQSLPKAGDDLNGAQYRWEFADGSIAYGKEILKVFSKAGLQNVKLTITDSRGLTDSLEKRNLSIVDITAGRLSFNSSLNDASSTQSHFESTGALSFVSKIGGGTAIALGGENGHLYLDKANDADFSETTQTKQLSFAVSIQANAADNSKSIALVNQHGAWAVNINNVSGMVQFSVGGKFFNFKPTVNLMDGAWHDVGINLQAGAFTLFVDGKKVFGTTLTASQSDLIFRDGGYGLGIGGTGPWKASTSTVGSNSFNLDNLYLGTTVLSDSQMASMALQNTMLA